MGILRGLPLTIHLLLVWVLLAAIGAQLGGIVPSGFQHHHLYLSEKLSVFGLLVGGRDLVIRAAELLSPITSVISSDKGYLAAWKAWIIQSRPRPY